MKPDPAAHKCVDNGAKVDLTNCSYSKGKGASELSTVWVDPDFKPSEKAFYYVRVLENPTCRWSTYDAIQTKSKLPEGYPATIQERAWSSPIWYEPNAAQVASK